MIYRTCLAGTRSILLLLLWLAIPATTAFQPCREPATYRSIAIERTRSSFAWSPLRVMKEVLEDNTTIQHTMAVETSAAGSPSSSCTTTTATSLLTDTNQSSTPDGGLVWRGVVVVLCALWASNFAATKLVMQQPNVDSTLFAVARFSVSAAALLPFVNFKTLDRETVQGAAVCGSWVAFGYLGQLLGLLTTTASRSCVICSLHCIFVAVMTELWRVSNLNDNSSATPTTAFDPKALAPAVLAVIGVAVVELHGAAGAPTIGDALSFAQPIGFGMGYLKLEELMKRRPETALAVSAIKLLVVAAASLVVFETQTVMNIIQNHAAVTSMLPDFVAILSSPMAMGGVLYTGLITTALALWVESIAFARVPATDASIILTTEPLFAAGFGAVSLGETFGMYDYVGAGLIVGACILATLVEPPKFVNQQT